MKKKEFDGFDDLFFWGRESGRLYSLDEYVLPELTGDESSKTEWGNDRNLLTLQRVLIRELIEHKILDLWITIYGAQAWCYRASFESEILIENQPKNNYSPLWIWWPEFFTILSDIPTEEVFKSDESFSLYNENYMTPDRKNLVPSGSAISVRPEIPGLWNRSENMSWNKLSDNRKSEFLDFLLGILSEHTMMPMEFLVLCIIYHPETPREDLILIGKLCADSKTNLPKSLLKAIRRRLGTSLS